MNYVSDTLLRLKSHQLNRFLFNKERILNTFFSEVYIYVTTVIEIYNIFKIYILISITTDKS